MKIHAVFNRDGGTFRTMNLEEYCRHASSVFGAHGNDFSCDIVAGKDVEDTLKKTAERDDLDAILAGGGDGTISTAAGICWRKGMPLGVVPAGTMNLFARSLHLPLDVYEVLDVLASGSIMDADIATANGRAYIHQYSVGLHSRMVRLRNSYTYQSRLGKMRASITAMVQVILDPPVFPVVCVVDGKGEDVRTSAISIANNRFGADPLLYAETLSGGELGIYIAGAMTSGSTIRLIVDILRGRLRQSEIISELGGREVKLRFPKLPKRANAVMDGELVPLESEVLVTLHAGELKVLVPANDTSGASAAAK